MLITGLISWWYGEGWRIRLSHMRQSLANMYDYFSIDLLVKTLFSPFRQISAGNVQGPLGVQMRALADKLFSRVIGAFVRSIMIVVGLIGMSVLTVFHFILLLGWPLVPAMPFIGIFLTITGWMPWNL